MATVKRVLLVGHCGADTALLSSVTRAALPDCRQSVVHSADQLKDAGPDTLLLVNRVLDGAFAVSGGVELIASLKAAGNAPRMMLISNYADAQTGAVAAGALPGFGKSAAHQAATLELLRRAAE